MELKATTLARESVRLLINFGLKGGGSYQNPVEQNYVDFWVPCNSLDLSLDSFSEKYLMTPCRDLTAICKGKCVEELLEIPPDMLGSWEYFDGIAARLVMAKGDIFGHPGEYLVRIDVVVEKKL